MKAVEKTWSTVVRMGKLVPVLKKSQIYTLLISLNICLKLCHELNEHFFVSGEGAGSVIPPAKSTYLHYFNFDRYILFTVKKAWRL